MNNLAAAISLESLYWFSALSFWTTHPQGADLNGFGARNSWFAACALDYCLSRMVGEFSSFEDFITSRAWYVADRSDERLRGVA